MNIYDAYFIKDVLGEDKVKKYLAVSADKINCLINILRYTCLKDSLTEKKFDTLCNNLVFGNYGKVFSDMLCNVEAFKKEEISLEYVKLIDMYIESGYNDVSCYFKIFNNLEKINKDKNFDYNAIMDLIYDEISDVTIEKVSISEYLEQGGSLDRVLTVLSRKKITNFDKDTKISCRDLKLSKKLCVK